MNKNSDMTTYNNSDMNIGKRLREARKAAGLSQAQLARRVGMKQPTISELEKGDSQGSKNLVELATAVNVTPEWLATGRDRGLAVLPRGIRFRNTAMGAPEEVAKVNEAAAKLIEAIEKAVSVGVHANIFESLKTLLDAQVISQRSVLPSDHEIHASKNASESEQMQKGRAAVRARLPEADKSDAKTHDKATGTGGRKRHISRGVP